MARARRACLAAVALLCLAAWRPVLAAETVAGLAAAEAAQASGKEPAAPVISDVIVQAGPAELARCASRAALRPPYGTGLPVCCSCFCACRKRAGGAASLCAVASR
jgi:hypothetical protein